MAEGNRSPPRRGVGATTTKRPATAAGKKGKKGTGKEAMKLHEKMAYCIA